MRGIAFFCVETWLFQWRRTDFLANFLLTSSLTQRHSRKYTSPHQCEGFHWHQQERRHWTDYRY